VLGTLAQLAQRVGGRTIGESSIEIARIAAIDEAGADSLTFATTPAYLQAALQSRAGGILVDESLLADAGDLRKPIVAVSNARVALMQLLRAFDRPRKRGPFVHPAAAVDPTVQLGADVYVGANVVIGPRSRVGDRSVIDAGAYIGEDVRVGADALLYAHASVMDACMLGDRVIVHPGAVIGSDGFGYVFVDGRFERIPQVGNVVLGNDVEIGANTCIDRAQTGSTQIGNGTKIDNLCQIGHNCRIGEHTGMAALCGLAGSTIVGDYVLVGGQAGFKGHITIGSRVKIGAGAKVWGDIPDDAFVSGTPARPHQEDLRREVMVRGLPKLLARVDALEKKLRQSGEA
jgi:UDP-3-O-[3-hydroxymyristoyl] glucosamine N-acyltransferase